MAQGTDLELGIVGLGTIGGNLARQAVEEGITVVGKDVEEKPELQEFGVTQVDSHEALLAELDPPRFVYLSLPAGPVIDDEIEKLASHLEAGDVVADGGNSFWLDSMEREERLREEGIYFLDAGTSGGLPGARNGACFMVGGREEGIEVAEPVFEALSVEGGFLHTGGPGSGHFVKLVHNGIEFGMLQAIGEGVELLKAGDFDVDLQEVFYNWTNGSVIRSWLVELMEEQLREEEMEEVPNYVEDTGEVNWLAMWAIKEETPAPVITTATMELFESRGQQDDAYQAIAMMRHGFGGHPFGVDDDIAKKRKISRLEEL